MITIFEYYFNVDELHIIPSAVISPLAATNSLAAKNPLAATKPATKQDDTNLKKSI